MFSDNNLYSLMLFSLMLFSLMLFADMLKLHNLEEKTETQRLFRSGVLDHVFCY